MKSRQGLDVWLPILCFWMWEEGLAGRVSRTIASNKSTGEGEGFNIRWWGLILGSKGLVYRYYGKLLVRLIINK